MIRVPTEVIKTRTQTSAYGDLGRSSLAAARQVLSNDGWKGFYRGFGTTIMREVCNDSYICPVTYRSIWLPDTFYITAIPTVRTPQGSARSEAPQETSLCTRSCIVRQCSWRNGSCPYHTTRRAENSSDARSACMFHNIYGSEIDPLIFTLLEFFARKTAILEWSTEGYLCNRGCRRIIRRRSTTDVVDISRRCRISRCVRVGRTWAYGVVKYISRLCIE